MTRNVDTAHGGLALFLKHELCAREEHPLGWDKYVYDIEAVHYGLLSLLLEDCDAFAAKLLRSPSKVRRVFLPSKRDLFDLEVSTSDTTYFIEVKTWHSLEADQFDRQTGRRIRAVPA